MQRTPWQVRLLVVLMIISGGGWFAWAAATQGLLANWLPDWPLAVIVAGGVVHWAGAWGLWQGRAWAWIIALLYMSIGAVSLSSQVAAQVLAVPQFLFVLESLALISAPYLIRKRGQLFRKVAYAG